MDYLNLLRLLAFLYTAALPLTLLIGALLLVGFLADGWRAKVFGMFLVLMVPVLLISPQVYKRKQANNIALERYEKANARFQEQCKKAGNFIYRTVEDVSAVLLLNVYPDLHLYSFDQYSKESGGDWYVLSYIEKLKSPPKNLLSDMFFRNRPSYGYQIVEAFDSGTGVRYRYRGFAKVVGQKNVNAPGVKKKLIEDPTADINIYKYSLDGVPSPDRVPPRYGVLYEKISDAVDREYWIAGGAVKVFDLQTKELLGERIEYMMDPGQGDGTNGRAPWSFAARNDCISKSTNGGYKKMRGRAVDFVVKVLQPKGGVEK